MVNQPGLGFGCLRVSVDMLPSAMPKLARLLPASLLLPLFAMKIPEMIVSYADAAAVMLNDLCADSPKSRKRVGLALPIGMRGKKDQWTAQAGS